MIDDLYSFQWGLSYSRSLKWNVEVKPWLRMIFIIFWDSLRRTQLHCLFISLKFGSIRRNWWGDWVLEYGFKGKVDRFTSKGAFFVFELWFRRGGDSTLVFSWRLKSSYWRWKGKGLNVRFVISYTFIWYSALVPQAYKDYQVSS